MLGGSGIGARYECALGCLGPIHEPSATTDMPCRPVLDCDRHSESIWAGSSSLPQAAVGTLRPFSDSCPRVQTGTFDARLAAVWSSQTWQLTDGQQSERCGAVQSARPSGSGLMRPNWATRVTVPLLPSRGARRGGRPSGSPGGPAGCGRRNRRPAPRHRIPPTGPPAADRCSPRRR